MIRRSLYHYACPQTCGALIVHLKSVTYSVNLPLEIERRESYQPYDLTQENWRCKKVFKVCDRDERRKCTVRVGFLAVFVAVKLQDTRNLWRLRSLDLHLGSALDPLGGSQRPLEEQGMIFGHCMDVTVIPPTQA